MAAKAAHYRPKTSASEVAMEDNLFAGLTHNRGSGSSNTTKTASDNSSRHSAASTAPSSTDYAPQPPQKDEWKGNSRKHVALDDIPPVPKPSGFLRQARTFSFGNKKNSLPSIPAEEPVPSIPESYSNEPATPGGRSRAPTTSSVSTATPPRVEDSFKLDLGGDLSTMFSKFDKRSSVATLKERNLTANRNSQPSPLKLDPTATIEPPQHSWNSQTSTDGLLGSAPIQSPANAYMAAGPPPVPRHNHRATPSDPRLSEEDDEDTTLLADSLAATQFLNSARAGNDTSSRYRRNDERPSQFRSTLTETYANDENMFANSPGRREKFAPRIGLRSKTEPPQTKVMTPEQFEQYRDDKVKREIMDGADKDGSDSEEEVNYDDDEEDDLEKQKQLAKQRRKQEAHMTVYRQQMMKVTGESASNAPPTRPNLSVSLSTPNLPMHDGIDKSRSTSPPSDGSSDEEVPLAILQAHGFPSRNRPPTRLSATPSNPNLRASMMQSQNMAGPGSISGDSNTPNGGAGGRLPPFARKLPRDPYLGAGLINQPPRESFALGGGAPAPNQNLSLPTGGLVGVIAKEERAKAMRRGSPSPMPPSMPMNGGFDPAAGIPPQMMYPMGMGQMQPPMMTPGDQAQIQMTQQMNQFMQMQMQFMQMMAAQGQGQGQEQGQLRPQGHTPTQSLGSVNDMGRNSFLGDPMGNGMGNGLGQGLGQGLSRDNQMRTMSMVQPSSDSWIQPPQPGYAPSIRIQGTGYAPSIAPSERSNIGLPGRYRPVSSIGQNPGSRTSTMSGALPTMSKLHSEIRAIPVSNKDDDDEDDEEGWEAMKAKREKKKNMWRSKKSFGSDIGALIS